MHVFILYIYTYWLWFAVNRSADSLLNLIFRLSKENPPLPLWLHCQQIYVSFHWLCKCCVLLESCGQSSYKLNQSDIVTYYFPYVVETAPQARVKTTWYGGSAFIAPWWFEWLPWCCTRCSSALAFRLFTHQATIDFLSTSSLLNCIEHTPITSSSLSNIKSERASCSQC